MATAYRSIRIGLGVLALIFFASPVTAQESTNWPWYGSDLSSSKYSPLDQINAENFADLEIAWRWNTPDAVLTMNIGGAAWTGPSKTAFDILQEENPDRWSRGRPPRIFNFKATPIVVDGILYLSSPLYQAAAVDAATGETIWIFDPKSYVSGSPTNINGFNHRGVSYWTDGTESRIVWGTGDGYLIAVDAKTGKPCEDFGENGRVDLMEGIPRADREARDFKNRHLLSSHSPPLISRDVILVPLSVSDDVITKENPPGWVQGYDVRTGEVLWTFHTIPQAGEFGVETWENDSWKYSGNANVWTQMSADEELGYAYLPVSASTNDYYGGHRLGDNLFAESLVCLNIETGERVWHFQFVHHGLWDYDLPAAPNLVDIVVDGKPIKAVAQITKQGFCFVFDRVTGEPVWPIEEREVPPATIPGDVASPTQPFPTKPAPYEYQGVTLDDLIDFTPELRAEALEVVKNYKIGPLYTPASLAVEGGTQGTIQRPSLGGGGNWWGAAVDPETGILYVPSRNSMSILRFYEANPDDGATANYTHIYGGGARMKSGLPIFKPPYSRYTAIDLNSGEHLWMVPNGNGDQYRNNPALEGLDLPALGGEGTGGPLLTKTLLISALRVRGRGGESERGTPRLIARDKATGQELASIDLPRSANGTPMTYMSEGRQYIAMTIQGNPPELIALSLPD